MRKPFRSCLVWGAVLNVFSLSSAGFAGTLRGAQAEPTVVVPVTPEGLHGRGRCACHGG